MIRPRRAMLHIALALSLLICVGAVGAGLVDFSPGFLRYIQDRWGAGALERLHNWRTTELAGIARHPKPPAMLGTDELQLFNQFWNKVPFYSDHQHWHADDYWATPAETLASYGADCEDYSIAKYFSLKELGVPPGSLRITYVRALKLNEPHMVLAYYPTPDAEPYILDNLSGKLVLASKRADLEPVYSFNDEDMWVAGATEFKGKSGQIRLWRELLEKMEQEQQM